MKRLIQNTRNVLARWSQSHMSIAAFCVVLFVPSGRVTAQSELPSLRRMQIHDGRAYVLDFEVPDAIGRVALLELTWEKESNTPNSKYYYIFGTDLGIVTGKRYDHRRAWTLTNNTLYLVVQHGRGAVRWAGFFRFPYDALIPGPGRFWDRAKHGIDKQDIFDFEARHKSYAPQISPLTNPLRGYETDDEGTVLAVWVYPKVTFDLTGSGGVPQLYVSINGRLSRHEFRKEKWKRLQDYDVQVHGEFVVASNGEALITKVDDHWCVVSDLGGKAKTRRIAKYSPDHHLLVVNDLITDSTYLVLDARMFNTAGTVLGDIKVGGTVQDRARRVRDSVLSLRDER